jgi:Photosynthesis system II assembly factor YCF48/Putative zinc-finger
VKEIGARENSAGKLLASALESGLSAGGAACPSAEILAAYIERSLTRKERERCEAHFATCASCQQQVAVLVRLEGEEFLPQEVRTPARGVRSWFTPHRLAWAAPALVAVIMAGVWITGDYRLRLQEPHMEIPSKSAAPPVAAPMAGTAPSPAPTVVAGQPARKKSWAREGEAIPAPLGRISGGAAGKAESLEDMASKGRSSSEIATLDNKHAEFERMSGENKVVAGNAPVAEAERTAAPPPPAVAKAASKDERAAHAEARAPAQPAPPVAAPQSVVVTDELRRPQAMMSTTPSVAVQAAAPQQSATAGAPAKPSRLEEEKSDQVKVGAVAQSVEMTSGKQAKSSRVMGALAGSDMLKRELSAWGDDWKVGRHGKIWHRTPAGTWVNENSGVKETLRAVAFATPQLGWVVGDHGTILRTTDGGATWLHVGSPTTGDILRINAASETAVTITSRDGKSYSTTDAGATWSLAGSPE